ncbi:MAG: hypothetical protein LBO74_05210 [Candidatus Symbiothrix sp.]|jgi:uncharacterized protein (TIGR02646 family)|nr:hypothetical protein [Candidatus Symbiothrix sp.]
MIKIHKSSNIPSVLTTKGSVETANLINAYHTNPSHPFSFDQSIYGHSTVKKQLIKEQHEKCCFCEAKFLDNSFGDVEHFRPKAAYKKRGASQLTYPGYYWLAYDWNNLMFSCEKCNRSYKKNEFPLNDETTRKFHHAHPNPLEKEDRLLINPIEEDPSHFITFKEEVPIAINNNLKGQTSIEVYGLERLDNSRLEHLFYLKSILPYANIDEANSVDVNEAAKYLKISTDDVVDLIKNAKALFNSAAKDSAKFALCVRCKFPYLPTI